MYRRIVGEFHQKECRHISPRRAEKATSLNYPQGSDLPPGGDEKWLILRQDPYNPLLFILMHKNLVLHSVSSAVKHKPFQSSSAMEEMAKCERIGDMPVILSGMQGAFIV